MAGSNGTNNPAAIGALWALFGLVAWNGASINAKLSRLSEQPLECQLGELPRDGTSHGNPQPFELSRQRDNSGTQASEERRAAGDVPAAVLERVKVPVPTDELVSEAANPFSHRAVQ